MSIKFDISFYIKKLRYKVYDFFSVYWENVLEIEKGQHILASHNDVRGKDKELFGGVRE